MPVDIVFGVKAQDIEEAYSWVESATGWTREARYSDGLGGDYYRFPPFDPKEPDDAPRLTLVYNRDPYDGDVVFDAPVEWDVVLSIQCVEADAEVVKDLEADREHFERLSEEKYD